MYVKNHNKISTSFSLANRLFKRRPNTGILKTYSFLMQRCVSGKPDFKLVLKESLQLFALSSILWNSSWYQKVRANHWTVSYATCRAVEKMNSTLKKNLFSFCLHLGNIADFFLNFNNLYFIFLCNIIVNIYNSVCYCSI